MNYCERIVWIRDCRSLTQKEVADYLGIKQQQYARYEKGINIMPITHLHRLCKILNISADFIVGNTDKELPFPKNHTKTNNGL